MRDCEVKAPAAGSQGLGGTSSIAQTSPSLMGAFNAVHLATPGGEAYENMWNKVREMWLYELTRKAVVLTQDFLKKCGGPESASCREAERILQSTTGTREEVKQQLDTLFIELQSAQT